MIDWLLLIYDVLLFVSFAQFCA